MIPPAIVDRPRAGSPLNIVILAAGDSTRMRSQTPKVLHVLAGHPLIDYSTRLAEALTDLPPVVVVGRDAEKVQAFLGNRARYVYQAERLGTGHAVLQARSLLAEQPGTVLVFYGDMPLLTEESMRRLLDLHHRDKQAVLSMLTFESDQPRGFGRIVRDQAGQVVAIVEEADCTPEQLRISELNPGLYCYDADWLWANIERMRVNAAGELNLTDLVEIAVSDGETVQTIACDPQEILGINTQEQLAKIERLLAARSGYI